jgi:hypothetical protein
MDKNRVELRLSGHTAYLVVTPAVGLYGEFDADKNGLLKNEEVQGAREAILSRFEHDFEVKSAGDAQAETILRDVSTPPAPDGTAPDGAEHLRFTLRYRFEREPAGIWIRWHRATEQPLSVIAHRVRDADPLPEQVPLDEGESVELGPMRPAHVFLHRPGDSGPQRIDKTSASGSESKDTTLAHKSSSGPERNRDAEGDAKAGRDAPIARDGGWFGMNVTREVISKNPWPLVLEGLLLIGGLVAVIRLARQKPQ